MSILCPRGHFKHPLPPNMENHGHLTDPLPLILSTWLLNDPFVLPRRKYIVSGTYFLLHSHQKVSARLLILAKIGHS